MAPTKDIVSKVECESKGFVEEFIKTEVELEENLPEDEVKAFENELTIQQEALGKEYGRKLRRVANDFQNSPQRRRVNDIAETAPLDVLQRETFSWMLSEIFSESYDLEGICVVMFFLRDLIVRCIKLMKSVLGCSILRWGVEFLQQRIAPWVAECGGWGVVLVRHSARTYIGSTRLTLGAALVAVVLGVIVYEKLKGD